MSIENQSAGAEATADAPAAETVVTHRRVGSLSYRAEAGYFDLVEEDHSGPLAVAPQVTDRFFLTSYVVDSTKNRPVVFFFNGGPGSASVWLHLGLFGPRIVPNPAKPGPYPVPTALVDNPDTLLGEADLVSIDLTDTGFSRVAAGHARDDFHGVVRDVESVSDLVVQWLSRHQRWDSPVFVAGESYGVLRSTKVAAHLAKRHGLYLSGLILISSTLGGATMRFGIGSVLGPVAFLPSYAALAWYHGLGNGKSLEDTVVQAEAFATGSYLRALTLGSRLSEEERLEVAREFSSLTGIDTEVLVRRDLRVPPESFRKELLRDQGIVIGRNDGRFTGWDGDNGSSDAQSDPSYDRIRGAYGAAANYYFRQELGFNTDLSYELITDRVKPWRADGPGYDSISALAQALRSNPDLKVNFSVGYYDICTPFFGAELDLAQLPIPRALQENITIDHYASGHMIYLDEESRTNLSRRLRSFVAETVAHEGSI